MSINIREYRPNDLDACRALWVVLTEWHRQIYDSPSIGGDDPGKQFDEHLAKVGAEHIWVAVSEQDDGRLVVGMTGMIPDDHEPELEPLIVLEPFRGRGIGRLLAERVIDAAKSEGVKYLKVRPVARNAEAIRAFHALGFDVLGHIHMFMDLENREDQNWRVDAEALAGRRFRI